jgi:hypothetical protein
MMLLAVLLAPLGLAALFTVMSWTERALDQQLKRTATTSRDGLLDGGRPAVEPSSSLGQSVAHERATTT